MTGLAQLSPLIVTHCSIPPIRTNPSSSNRRDADAQAGRVAAGAGAAAGDGCAMPWAGAKPIRIAKTNPANLVINAQPPGRLKESTVNSRITWRPAHAGTLSYGRRRLGTLHGTIGPA